MNTNPFIAFHESHDLCFLVLELPLFFMFWGYNFLANIESRIVKHHFLQLNNKSKEIQCRKNYNIVVVVLCIKHHPLTFMRGNAKIVTNLLGTATQSKNIKT